MNIVVFSCINLKLILIKQKNFNQAGIYSQKKYKLQLISTHFSLHLNLKSDSHVPENFCQIKIFPSLVQKNIIICFSGV